ncbi:hypothetical protein C8J56DRAFT_1038046 [Mycena floridula]|nr:hypothetical protein C8J56DRAFT_1038046 [Mycena floridula]
MSKGKRRASRSPSRSPERSHGKRQRMSTSTRSLLASMTEARDETMNGLNSATDSRKTKDGKSKKGNQSGKSSKGGKSLSKGSASKGSSQMVTVGAVVVVPQRGVQDLEEIFLAPDMNAIQRLKARGMAAIDYRRGYDFNTEMSSDEVKDKVYELLPQFAKYQHLDYTGSRTSLDMLGRGLISIIALGQLQCDQKRRALAGHPPIANFPRDTDHCSPQRHVESVRAFKRTWLRELPLRLLHPTNPTNPRSIMQYLETLEFGIGMKSECLPNAFRHLHDTAAKNDLFGFEDRIVQDIVQSVSALYRRM